MVKLSLQRFWIGPTLVQTPGKPVMVMPSRVVSSWHPETASLKSGQEIGTFMMSVDQGFATFVILFSDCIFSSTSCIRFCTKSVVFWILLQFIEGDEASAALIGQLKLVWNFRDFLQQIAKETKINHETITKKSENFFAEKPEPSPDPDLTHGRVALSLEHLGGLMIR